MRDRQSQFAIGLFVATFVHTLLTIREVDPGDPGEPGQVPGVALLTTFVLALVSIAVLVVYIHHIGQALRVSALVEIAGDNTRKLVRELYPLKDELSDVDDPQLVTAEESGVITQIAHDKLVKTARDAGCVLELIPALGEFVPAGAPLFGFTATRDGCTTRRCAPPSWSGSSGHWSRTSPTGCGCSSTSLSGPCPTHPGRTRRRPCRPSIGCTTAYGSWYDVRSRTADATTRTVTSA